jgi:hypothetical protein
MEKGKLTILFIRDDSTVRRFRIRPVWVKLMVYLFLLALVLAAASSYGAYALWNKYAKLRDSHNQLEMDYHEMQVDLERLQNMEKLRQTRIQTDKALREANATKPEKLPMEAGAPSKPSRLDENELAARFPPLDKDLIEVDNLIAKTTNDNSLRVTFDIKNVDEKDRPLSGWVNLSLLTWRGDKLPLDINRSNLSFRIQWFKSMKTTFPLPKGQDLKDIYALRVTVINKAKKPILQETYPLDQLLSQPEG